MLAFASPTGFAYEAHHASPANAGDSERRCVAMLARNKHFKPLKDKLALSSVRGQPFAMVFRDSRPLKHEKPLIAAWLKSRGECFRMGQARRAAAAQLHEQVLAESIHTRFASLTMLLLAGELTYGEYARARMELSMDAVFAFAETIADPED
jgi:hypothetical protein